MLDISASWFMLLSRYHWPEHKAANMFAIGETTTAYSSGSFCKNSWTYWSHIYLAGFMLQYYCMVWINMLAYSCVLKNISTSSPHSQACTIWSHSYPASCKMSCTTDKYTYDSTVLSFIVVLDPEYMPDMTTSLCCEKFTTAVASASAESNEIKAF